MRKNRKAPAPALAGWGLPVLTIHLPGTCADNPQRGALFPAQQLGIFRTPSHYRRDTFEEKDHGRLIYLIGLIVVIMAILSFFGLR
jgi:hypothetical protein